MPNYQYYRERADEEEDEYTQPEQQVSSESPASAWIASVENPESVVSQYGTEYGTAEQPESAVARGTVNRSTRNVDQWGNETPAQTPSVKQQFTIPAQYKGANARELADIMGAGSAVSMGQSFSPVNTLRSMYKSAADSIRSSWSSYLGKKR